MKKLSYSLCVAVVVAPLLMQCASQDELNQIHYQLRRLDKKVTDLESKTIDDMQKRYASTSVMRSPTRPCQISWPNKSRATSSASRA